MARRSASCACDPATAGASCLHDGRQSGGVAARADDVASGWLGGEAWADFRLQTAASNLKLRPFLKPVVYSL
jgi:hypothetical protein